MSTSVTEIARQFIRAWNAGQRHVVDELAAPTLTVSYPHFPEPLEGPEAFKEMLAQTHHFFPDLTMYRVEGGRVQEERGIVDNFGLMTQLGAEPTAADRT